MTTAQFDRLRNVLPRGWRQGQEGAFFNHLIILLSQITTSTEGDSGDTITINEAESDVLSTVARVQDLEYSQNDLARLITEPVDLGNIEERIEDLDRQVCNIMMGLNEDFKSAAVDGGQYYAVDRELITAALNATIFLPSRPVANSVIIVKKIDNSTAVLIDGNGKTIDSNARVSIRNQNTALTMQYDVERDAWFIR